MLAPLFPYLILGMVAGPWLYFLGWPTLGAAIALASYPGAALLWLADLLGSPLMRD